MGRQARELRGASHSCSAVVRRRRRGRRERVDRRVLCILQDVWWLRLGRGRRRRFEGVFWAGKDRDVEIRWMVWGGCWGMMEKEMEAHGVLYNLRFVAVEAFFSLTEPPSHDTRKGILGTATRSYRLDECWKESSAYSFGCNAFFNGPGALRKGPKDK